MANEDAKEIAPRQAWRGLQALAGSLAPVLKPTIAKRGFAAADLLSAWGEIVGPRYARCTLPEYIRYDAHLMAITRHFFDKQKPVASVCHGVEIIAAADVIRGKRVATVAKCAMDVTFSGGTFVNEGCVRDGNLVSGRTWHDNHLFMREFMLMLAEADAQ